MNIRLTTCSTWFLLLWVEPEAICTRIYISDIIYCQHKLCSQFKFALSTPNVFSLSKCNIRSSEDKRNGISPSTGVAITMLTLKARFNYRVAIMVRIKACFQISTYSFVWNHMEMWLQAHNFDSIVLKRLHLFEYISLELGIRYINKSSEGKKINFIVFQLAWNPIQTRN